MKKTLSIIAAVCAAACCLAACDNGSQPQGYEKLNEMLQADYSEVVITVTDAVDSDLTLTSEYTVVYGGEDIMVVYTVEKLASLSLDAPAADAVVTLSGSAVIRGGQIVSSEGDDVGISAAIAERGMQFEEEYFENAQFTDGTFNADVISPNAFFGTVLGGVDVTVSALFSQVFDFISVEFVSAEGHSMEIRYTFTV